MLWILLTLYLSHPVLAGQVSAESISPAPVEAPTPFWKKPKVFKKIVEDRAIIVSADCDKEGEQYHMRLVTAGHIKAPIKFTWQKLQEFENYPKWTDHFTEVKFYPENKRLFLHGVALGWHAEMSIQMKFFEGEKTRAVEFEVIEGNFLGMKGHIRLEEFSPDKTEISMESNFLSPTIPLPKVLMGVGLEGVGQRVAGIIRQQIETQYKK